MIQRIEVWDRFHRPGVMLWSDEGNGFHPMILDGNFVCFRDEIAAETWLMKGNSDD